MATKDDLKNWVIDAIQDHGGSATVVQVAEHIWNHHEDDLRQSGSLFFTWQYATRWSALELRRTGALKPVVESPRGTWQIAE